MCWAMFWLTIVILLPRVYHSSEVEFDTTKIPCNGDDCGTSSEELLTSPLTCFECRHCNNVTTSDLVIECNFAACCYVAVVMTDYGNQETFAVRGCAPANTSCHDGCKKIQLEHQLAHSNGTFGYCMTCKGNECNANKYIPSILVTREVYNGVNCYECRNCNKINATTPTVRCSQPECCYTAVLKDTLDDDKNFAVRGCVKQNCSDTCKTIKDRQAHADEMFSYCMTCGNDAGDYCNGNVYSPKLIDEHNCFDCEHCNEIKLDTVKVRCDTKCCYSKIVMGKYQRGCAVDLNGGSCEDYCGKHIDGLCDSCSTNNCNSLRFPNDTSATDRFKCYNCKDCETVSSSTPRSNCKSNCCATVVKTVRGVSSSYRNCVWGSCQQYCGYAAKSSKKIYYCKICNSNECNGEPTQTSVTLSKREAPVNCYSCKNCKFVNRHTPKVYCHNRCCFVNVFREDDGSIVAKRGCTRIKSGTRMCSQYCEQARKDYAAVHTPRKFYCAVCSSTACNGQQLDNTFRPTGIPGYYPKVCYSCMNCYDIEENTATVQCPDGCCYTAIWTEHTRKSFVRLCALLDGQRCEHYCNHLAARVAEDTVYFGDMHYCRTCSRGRCNSEPPPDNFEPSIPHFKDSIMCYHCDNCADVTTHTRIVLCPSGCCSSQLKFTNDGRRIQERQCAKLFPGTSCHRFCAYAENLHRRYHPRGLMSFCKACPVNKCNNVKLNTAEIGKIDKPIDCYECDNCYAVGNQILKNCTTGCCYTMISANWKMTNLNRNCVEHEFTPCADYCDIREIAMFYADPTFQIIDCKVCKSNLCNHLVVEEPTTIKPIVSCYTCENCLKLTSTDDIETCNSRCCYTAITWNEKMYGMMSERGCADLLPKESCVNFCESFENKGKKSNTTTNNCTFCDKDRCNHINLEPMVKMYRKLNYFVIDCYVCQECNGTCRVDEPPCDQTEECYTSCCFTGFSEKDGTLRGCAPVTLGKSCTHEHIKKHLKESYGSKYMQYFRACAKDNCNNESDRTTKCYECKDCDNGCGPEENPCNDTKTCDTECCYSLYNTYTHRTWRGCATAELNCSKPAIKTWLAKEIGENDEGILRTDVCDLHLCNIRNEWITKCYTCGEINCNTTDDCSSNCCYTAVLHKNEVRRACMIVEKNRSCNNDYVRSKLLQSYAVNNITYFEACSYHLCNNVSKWTKKCYECRNCNDMCGVEETNCQKTIDCENNTYRCYTSFSQKGEIFRGCLTDLTDEELCGKTNMTEKLQVIHNNTSMAYVHTCSGHLCNTINKWEFQCYQCANCSNNCRHTEVNCQKKVNCSHHCCYSAKSTEGQVFRGCAAVERNGSCTHELIRNIFLNSSITMEYFEACNTDKCNIVHKWQKQCYNCSNCIHDCGVEQEHCKSLENCDGGFCYSAYSKNMETFRGCIKWPKNKPFTHQNLKTELQNLYSSITMICFEPCHSHLCNTMSNFNTKCFDCTNCTDKCGTEQAPCNQLENCDGECCYSAHSKRDGFTSRGCLMLDKGEISCTDTYLRGYLASHYENIDMKYFETCTSHVCNIVTDWKTKCYLCDNCTDMCGPEEEPCNNHTNCDSGCCYAAYSDEFNTFRGCLKLDTDKSCTNENLKANLPTLYPNINMTYFEICTSHLCNIVTDWKTKCYLCDNCTKKCGPEEEPCNKHTNCESGCCYAAHSKENRKTFRGCFGPDDDKSCTNENLKANLPTLYPNINMTYFEICTSHLCNIVTDWKTKCYLCDNCTDMCGPEEEPCNNHTNCDSGCCYSAYSDEFNTFRGCLKLDTDKSCTNENLKANLPTLYPNINMTYFEICTSHLCNIVTDWKTKCYLCDNCTDMCGPEEEPCNKHTNCENGCCYAAYSKENRKTFRGCFGPDDDKSCTNENLKANLPTLHPNINMTYFEICTSHLCNIVTDWKTKCYLCDNCTKKCGPEEEPCNKHTNCENGCCFSMYNEVTDETNRGCAQLSLNDCSDDGIKTDRQIEDKLRIKACTGHLCNTENKWENECYTCTNCTANCDTDEENCMNQTICSTNCCFSVYNEETKITNRGCVTEDRSANTCTEKNIQLWVATSINDNTANPRIQACSIHKCNTESKWEHKCYNCTNCVKECTDDDKLCDQQNISPISCKNGCCYSIHFTESNEIERGCAKPLLFSNNLNCNSKYIKTKIFKNYSNDQVQIQACTGHLCNTRNKWDMECYTCVCSSSASCGIDQTLCKDTIDCSEKCCFSARNNKYTVRGCATTAKKLSNCNYNFISKWLRKHQWENIQNIFPSNDDLRIEPCTKHLCNVENRWDIECYHCENCSANCGPDDVCSNHSTCIQNCCYSMYHTEHRYAIKGCAADIKFEGNGNCNIENLKTWLKEKKHLPSIDKLRVKTCGKHLCNIEDEWKISCYKCRNSYECRLVCNSTGINSNNCGRPVECSIDCCYYTYNKHSDDMYRGCLELDTIRSCNNEYLKTFISNKLLKSNDITNMKIFGACDTDLCNFYDWKADVLCYNCVDCQNTSCGDKIQEGQCKSTCKVPSRDSPCCFTEYFTKTGEITRGCCVDGTADNIKNQIIQNLLTTNTEKYKERNDSQSSMQITTCTSHLCNNRNKFN